MGFEEVMKDNFDRVIKEVEYVKKTYKALKEFGIKIDEEDIEESLLERRLIREITYGDIPSLLELTKIARKVIQEDLEHAIGKVVDTSKSDYAMLTGIQIHAPDANYVWPADSYVVIDGKKEAIQIE